MAGNLATSSFDLSRFDEKEGRIGTLENGLAWFGAWREQINAEIASVFALEDQALDAKEEIAQRWLWVVCNRIDGVDREHTTFVLRKNAFWATNWTEGGQRIQIQDAKLYHSKNKPKDIIFGATSTLRDKGSTHLTRRLERFNRQTSAPCV